MPVFVWQLSGVFTVALRSDSLKAWIGALLAACPGGFHTELNVTLAGVLWWAPFHRLCLTLEDLDPPQGLQTSPLSAWIPVSYYGDDTQGGNRCDLGSSLCGQQYLEERQREGVMGFTVLLQGEGTPTPVCTSEANEGTGSCFPYQNNEPVKASLMTKASYGKCLLCTYTEFFLLRGNSLNNSTWLLASLSTILGSRKFDYKH